MPEHAEALSLFHPLIARWFVEKYGDPTDVQEQGWPRIANVEHVLITAPTGSGKTLTAFLWAINQLVTQQWRTGHISVLYVSPLRALNNDIYRNLRTPLSELKRVFEEAGEFFPAIHVPPDDPDLHGYLAPLRHLLTREFQPMRRMTVETINGEEAFQSPYLEALRDAFEAVIDHKYVTLYRSGKSWGTH
jgi:hypothetical protein